MPTPLAPPPPNRRHFLTGGAAAALALPNTGCWALLIYGGEKKNPRSDQVMWGFVILDLLISVWIWVGVPLPIPIGLLIDFATGAIYKPLRLMGPTDLAPDDESLPEEDDGARRTVDGEMLAILVPFCEEGNRFLTEAGPDRLIAAAITFREHIETCKTCAGALLALGRPSRIKRPSADGTVISNEPLPVRLTAGTVVSPEAYAQLRESADAPSLFSVPT